MQSGFTLLEVLIALLVLAVGLLGFAMLQVMNVRFTESANYRTKATQLADTLLDQVRADRTAVASYVTTYTGSNAAAGCVPTTGAVSASTFKTFWQCQLGRALGDGATATVTQVGTSITVSISWNDDRWNVNSLGNQIFSTSTQL
ncbi:type IV pilus assembly protein PilV [Pseudoxanthomonas sp. GM95]|nr:type IV pilus assembly protein PilV [Pseudoxanthomonas sp. GM95]